MKKSTINPEWTKSSSGFQFFRTGLIISLLLFSSVIFAAYSKSDDEAVMQAFQLRMNGKSDQAKELLINIIKEDPKNALAQYELARTLNYINMFPTEDASKAMKTAKDLEPENVIYAYGYAKNCFLEAFMAMQQGNGDVKALIGKTCDEFNNVLKMDPGYNEALMYLVEIYGMLPAEMGGDKIKAEQYAQTLEKQDKFYGARARLLMMPEGTNMVEYWKNYIAKNGESLEALKALGAAALLNEDVETAKESFTKAMAKDKSQNIRVLDLARFHMMKVMQNRDAAAAELPKSITYIDQYLASTLEPILPLKAYALGMKINIERILGNNEEAEKAMKDANALDPHFSRAFGIPSMAQFEPPTKPDHQFVSFFSPF